jgi:hypothetical protein
MVLTAPSYRHPSPVELSFRIYSAETSSSESSVENLCAEDVGEDDPDKFELVIKVNLRTLCSIGNVQLKNISSLPVNSLLFATDEGYYACSSLFERVRIPISGISNGAEQLTIRAAADKGHDNIDSDAAIRAKMDTSLKTIEVLREEASASLSDMEAARDVIQRSAKAEALEKVSVSFGIRIE